MSHYYNKKYPYLCYSFTTDTDDFGIMFSIPPELLAMIFTYKFGHAPKTFFDCGAATGEIVSRALKCGMDARGIDIKKYRGLRKELADLFKKDSVQIKSILDCEPIQADIVYCNGTLTYFNENELPQVLDKFKNSKLLCAIHKTQPKMSWRQGKKATNYLILRKHDLSNHNNGGWKRFIKMDLKQHTTNIYNVSVLNQYPDN